jgi:aminopeptidase N
MLDHMMAELFFVLFFSLLELTCNLRMKDLDQQAKTIYLKDYQQPDYWIDHVDLTFELEEEKTRVISKLQIKKHDNSSASSLVLMGECLELGVVDMK